MITYESADKVYLGASAALVEQDRELAWAERYVTKNEAYKWILGRFVEADQPNDNGHLFPLDQLKAAQNTIANSPLNMLHRPHHVVGAFAATEMIYPVGGPPPGGTGWVSTAAGDDHPHVEALAAFWRYYFPDEYRAVEEAHNQGSLFYSMECVPTELGCLQDGCEQVFAYDGRSSTTYCDHLNAPLSAKRVLGPHFTGGALIIPPVRPGWKRADITQLSSLIEENVEQAENIYAGLEQDLPHLSPRQWEQMMAMVLQTGEQGRKVSGDERDKMASKGTAMPDGSFPIANVSDLKNAIQAYGRAKNKAAVKAHIIKRAKALGATNLLPDDWA